MDYLKLGMKLGGTLTNLNSLLMSSTYVKMVAFYSQKTKLNFLNAQSVNRRDMWKAVALFLSRSSTIFLLFQGFLKCTIAETLCP